MSSFDTNFLFEPRKLTIALDGSAGSSGKGKLGSFICEHANNWQFACNTFTPQAGHWVKLDDDRSFFYQTLNSCAYMVDRYEKLYIAPGAAIDLDAFFCELEANNVPAHKIGISGLTSLLQQTDTRFEKGLCTFEGHDITDSSGGYLAKTGSTAHGCGANRAKRVLRRPDARYARDEPRLREFICDVPGEIMDRLDRGQSGFMEIAQGFQLSYLLPNFFPHTTSRNCTVAAGLDDLMVPPYYAGNVVLNFRTFPIRICSEKYIDNATRDHLTWDQVVKRTSPSAPTKDILESAGITLVDGNSGHSYPDQNEISWADVTRLSRSPDPIIEYTSVTQLPRRVFTFSRANFFEAIRHNRTSGEPFISLNFANYIDYELLGRRGKFQLHDVANASLQQWLCDNLKGSSSPLKFVGTGAKTNDMIQID